VRTIRIDEVDPIAVVGGELQCLPRRSEGAERRGARAVEDGTTVLAIGGARGKPFRVSPWEFAFAGPPAYKAKRHDEAEALLREGLRGEGSRSRVHPRRPALYRGGRQGAA
jgi:hypothetical protein